MIQSSPAPSLWPLFPLAASLTWRYIGLMYPQLMFILLLVLITPHSIQQAVQPATIIWFTGVGLLLLLFQVGWQYLVLFKAERRWLRWEARPCVEPSVYQAPPQAPLVPLEAPLTPTTHLKEAMAVMPLFTGIGRYAVSGMVIQLLTLALPWLLLGLTVLLLMWLCPIHTTIAEFITAFKPVMQAVQATPVDLQAVIEAERQLGVFMEQAAPPTTWLGWMFALTVAVALITKVSIFLNLWLPMVLLGQCDLKEGLRASWALFKRYPIGTTFMASTSFLLMQLYGLFAFVSTGWAGVLGNLLGMVCLIYGSFLQYLYLLQRTGAYPSKTDTPEPPITGTLIDTHA